MLAVVACSSAAADLDGTKWALKEFGEEGGETAVLLNTTITLNFEDGQIGGSSGCNSYFGDVVITGETLSISEIGSTLMACLDEGVSQQEVDFLAALAEVSSYTLAENQLTLQYDGGVLVFEVGE